MRKDDCRKIYKSKRAAFSEKQRDDLSIAIANQSLKLPIWHLEHFHIFMPIEAQKEIDTTPLITVLQAKEKHIYIPKVKGLELEHYAFTDQTLLRQNKWGISEPVTGETVEASIIDIVFIPLLGFDQRGNRVGYGKGFYDRFLKNCNEKAVKIGLSFFKAEEDITADPHDIRLDYCVTPDQVYTFNPLG